MSTYIVVAEYKGKKFKAHRGPSTFLVSEHATLPEAKWERDRHVSDYGDELESVPLVAEKIEE